jgi:hypothetical protein
VGHRIRSSLGTAGRWVRTFEATPVIGESTRAASLDAEAWLVTRHNGGG